MRPPSCLKDRLEETSTGTWEPWREFLATIAFCVYIHINTYKYTHIYIYTYLYGVYIDAFYIYIAYKQLIDMCTCVPSGKFKN